MIDRDLERQLQDELAQLQQEHRDLDAAIEAMAQGANADAMRLQRLKKRKLALKDRIVRIEDQLFPDISA